MRTKQLLGSSGIAVGSKLILKARWWGSTATTRYPGQAACGRRSRDPGQPFASVLWGHHAGLLSSPSFVGRQHHSFSIGAFSAPSCLARYPRQSPMNQLLASPCVDGRPMALLLHWPSLQHSCRVLWASLTSHVPAPAKFSSALLALVRSGREPLRPPPGKLP